MFYPMYENITASNTSCVCNRFLEFLQSGFYTASLLRLPNPSFSKVPLVLVSLPRRSSVFIKSHPSSSFLQTGKILTLSASNFKKNNVHSSPAPRYQRMPFHEPELATKLGKPSSDGKDLDTLREALALARLPPPPPPPFLLLLQPQVEGKWRKRRDSDRFVMRFEEGLRHLIFLLVCFQRKKEL